MALIQCFVKIDLCLIRYFVYVLFCFHCLNAILEQTLEIEQNALSMLMYIDIEIQVNNNN